MVFAGVRLVVPVFPLRTIRLPCKPPRVTLVSSVLQSPLFVYAVSDE